MHPDLFKLVGVAFPSYFVLLLSGFLFATAAGALWARRIGESADVIVNLGLAMLLAGSRGRILHVLVDGYFWDYVHLCTDPSRVDWPLDKGEWLPRRRRSLGCGAGVCHRHADCLRGEFLGGWPHLLRRADRRGRRRLVSAATRSVPLLEGGGHGGLRRTARAGLRPHGVPARGVLLRQRLRSALGDLVSVEERGERGRVHERQ